MPRAPFVAQAVLIVVTGDAAVAAGVPREHQSDSPCPAIDALAAAGVTTDLVHPPGAAADGLPPDSFPSAPFTAITTALLQLVRRDVRGARVPVPGPLPPAILALTAAEMQHYLDAPPPSTSHRRAAPPAPPPPQLIVVDAAGGLDVADALVARLLPDALRPAGGDDVSPRSQLLLGVLAAGEGWPAPADGPPVENGSVPFFRPVQSCDAGRQDTVCYALKGERADGPMRVVGAVAWAGSGATRVDAVDAFDGRRRGGEGRLLVSQMLAEVLAKVGLRPKFGA